MGDIDRLALRALHARTTDMGDGTRYCHSCQRSSVPPCPTIALLDRLEQAERERDLAQSVTEKIRERVPIEIEQLRLDWSQGGRIIDKALSQIVETTRLRKENAALRLRVTELEGELAEFKRQQQRVLESRDFEWGR
jgi:hypothetical protein